MVKATVRIFKNHGFKQINRNIEELKFTLLDVYKRQVKVGVITMLDVEIR